MIIVYFNKSGNTDKNKNFIKNRKKLEKKFKSFSFIYSVKNVFILILYKKFDEYNTHIIGISKDSIEKHKKFKNKHSLSIDLASDDGSICELFDVWKEKSMYGKKYMGIERATFFFDENLQLTHEWRNVKVKGHVEDVLDFILSN